MKKYYLDTNILLDFCIQDRPQSQRARELFERAVQGEFRIGISEDILTTLYYIAQKHVEKEFLLNFFEFFKEEFSIESFCDPIIDDAIEYCRKHKTDLEDTLQAFCAKHNNYDCLLSHDKKFVGDIIEIKTSL